MVDFSVVAGAADLLIVLLVDSPSALLFLGDVVACLDQLEQSEFGHALAALLVEVGGEVGLHADLVLLTVEPEYFFDFGQAQVEAPRHETEEGVGEEQGEEPDDARADQLDGEEAPLASCEQALLLVHETESDHTPEPAEQVGLGSLEWVVELVSVEKEA